jgi:CDP-diacylglycerol--glycerol-3-phosphate 3-phosphatidyltransferase
MATTHNNFVKNIPNMLSITRIILALVVGGLAFTYDRAAIEAVGGDLRNMTYWLISAFLLVCITTDVLDGFLARKLKVCSKFGANMDIIGDVLTIGAMFIFVFFKLKVFQGLQRGQTIAIGVTTGSLFFYRILTAIITKFKFGKFSVMHTIGNKVAGGGIVVCAIVLILTVGPDKPVLWPIYATFGLLFASMTEEVFLIAKDKVYNVDRKGFLFDKPLPLPESNGDGTAS